MIEPQRIAVHDRDEQLLLRRAALLLAVAPAQIGCTSCGLCSHVRKSKTAKAACTFPRREVERVLNARDAFFWNLKANPPRLPDPTPLPLNVIPFPSSR